MFSSKSQKRLLSLLFAAVLLLEAQPAGAVPARRLTEFLPPAAAGAETCAGPVHRFRAGPGRRPGATVVPVTVRVEVLNTDGVFSDASSDATRAVVTGDDVVLRVLVANLSLYDIGHIVLTHDFTPAPDSADAEGIGGIEGARFDERSREFLIDRVASGETASFTFHLFLNGNPGEGISQSKMLLKDFDVLESERRYPVRTPETPLDRPSQSLERLGIGFGDVACFAGAMPALPPILTPQAGGGMERSPLSIQKIASRSEASPGALIVFSIIVTNHGTEILRNVVVDDRFDSTQLKVTDAGGGEVLPSGIQWVIPVLAPDGRFVARYSAEILPGAKNGDHIANTATLVSHDLLDIPAPERRATAEVAIVTAMPRTGVDLGIFFLGSFFLGMVLFFGTVFFGQRLVGDFE